MPDSAALVPHLDSSLRRMKVRFIPALTEATSPFFRPIKYSLFPPLGLATLAAYLDVDDEAEICDEHVEPLVDDDTPDLVVIQVHIFSDTTGSQPTREGPPYGAVQPGPDAARIQGPSLLARLGRCLASAAALR